METKVDSTAANELLKNNENNVDCLQPITELDEESEENLDKALPSKNNTNSTNRCSQPNKDTDDNDCKESTEKNSVQHPIPDNKFFFEDEVFRLDKRGNIKFGLIIESSGSHSGDEDDEYDESLSKGDVRAVWYPEGQEVIIQENLIGLADRSLMPGDVVRRLVPGSGSQRGYCRDIHMKADVQILGSKYVIKNVNAERLRSVNKWQRDNVVCLDSWVGSVKDIEEKAILRTVLGCRIEISSRDFLLFKDLKTHCDRDVFNPQIFYPGNTLVGSVTSIENLNILTPDIPLHINKKGKTLTRKFIVESVYVESVWVHWQCKALSDEKNLNIADAVQPPIRVAGEDLKRLKPLDLFDSCMLQINDRNYMTISSNDNIVRKCDWQFEQNKKYIHILLKQRPDCCTINMKGLNRSLCNCQTKSNKCKKSYDITDEAHKTCVKIAKKLNLKNSDIFMLTDIQKAIYKKYHAINENGNDGDGEGEVEKDKDKEKEIEADVEKEIIDKNKDKDKDVDDNFNDKDKNKNNHNSNDNNDADDSNDNVKDDKDNKEKHADIDNSKDNAKDKSLDEEWISEDDTASMDDVLEMSSSSTTSKPHNLYKAHNKNKNYQKNLPILKNKSSITTNKETTNPELSKNTFSEDRNSLHQENPTINSSNLGEHNIKPKKVISICSSLSLQSGNAKYSNHRLLKKKPHKFLSLKAITNKTEELVTEALLIHSTATVIWQDGTVENDIPSTELYPIHHLDTHEFFPGDFVVSGKDNGEMNFREYGVIQTVDHLARIARVKWFTTYTSIDDPTPIHNGESEVSVYDLKDHPDFQYRPGTMVIRVANFDGDDAAYTTGQIIDNFTDGRVKVWWVDGRISMCWPQDLFEVGQYDNGEWGHDSDDSWETESENSEFGGTYNHNAELSMTGSHILVNIEKARVAISRLEEIFSINPTLQSPEVMKKLLNVYKICRYMDRLLSTNFFHEDHFKGLIERVRKVGIQSIHERAQDQKKRLFNDSNSSKKLENSSKEELNQSDTSINNTAIKLNINDSLKDIQNDIELLEKITDEHQQSLSSLSTTSFNDSLQTNTLEDVHLKTSNQSSLPIASETPEHETQTNELQDINLKPVVPSLKQTSLSALSEDIQCDKLNELLNTNTENSNDPIISNINDPPNNGYEENDDNDFLITSCQIDNKCSGGNRSVEMNINVLQAMKSAIMNSETDNNSEKFDGNSAIADETGDADNISHNSESNYELRTVPSEMVCERLCSLLKAQILKFVNFIRTKYFKAEDTLDLSDLFNNADLEDNIFGLFTEDITITTIKTDNKTPNAENPEKDIENDTDEKIAAQETSPSKKPTDDLPSAAITTCDNTALAETKNDMETSESFILLPLAPKSHKYYQTTSNPNKPQQYHKTILKEYRLLKNCLPSGIWVRVFEDRMDLLSVMIEGPKKTPYEDGMFLFDVQLPNDYPRSPPLCHYISYCSDRLNPNLYEDGKVCVSLLGTWTGKDTEVWCANSSTLLQVIVSIQGLILVPEPYFNEAGYEKQRGTQQGKENSRMYNEMVIIKLTQATTKLLQDPPEIFREQIQQHFVEKGLKMYERINGYMKNSKDFNSDTAKNHEKLSVEDEISDFPLVPASRGFCISLTSFLEAFKQKLVNLIDLSNLSNPSTSNINTAAST